MKKVIILRHVDCEGPGYLLDVFQRKGIPYEIVKIDEGDVIPTSTDHMLALVSMGGSMSANDDLPWISAELSLLRSAADKGLPILGHCLGAQLLAKVLGGEITANPVREIGWFDVSLEKNKEAEHWFSGLPESFGVFHWHGETFSTPPNAQNILSSAHCENQCFVQGNILGFQCHIEMTAALVKEWAQRFKNEIDSSSATEQSSDFLVMELDSRITALNKAADTIYERWISTFAQINPRILLINKEREN